MAATLRVHYDADGKTLTVWFDDPNKEFGAEETGEEVVIIRTVTTFGHVFFPWYNEEHHHSALGFLTPAVVHYGMAKGVSGRWRADGRRAPQSRGYLGRTDGLQLQT